MLKDIFGGMMGVEGQSIFYDRTYTTIYLPSFNVLSVKALLQFLYTGEVGKPYLILEYYKYVKHRKTIQAV